MVRAVRLSWSGVEEGAAPVGLRRPKACNKTANAYYSYATCGGNAAPWQAHLDRQRHVRSLLEKRTFRVFMPNYKPYMYDCSGTTPSEDARETSCDDDYSSCNTWKELGAEGCDNPAMRHVCPRTCGLCTPVPQSLGRVPECTPQDGVGMMGKRGFVISMMSGILARVEADIHKIIPTARGLPFVDAKS